MRIFRESRCKDTTSQRGRVGLPLVSLGKFGNNLFSLGFVGFRWVSAFIIYIYIYYICMHIERESLTFCKMTIYKTNIVPPWKEVYIINIYIYSSFASCFRQ